MGAREWIYVAVAVLAVYLVFQLIRALQVREPSAGDDEDEDDLESMANEALDKDSLDTGASPVDDEAPPRGVESASAPPVEDSFALALEVRQLRRDIAQLRDELDAQRNEVSAMREIMASQTQQIEAARAAQRVSPIYGEALALAQRGMAADVIAERCSISVAEAEHRGRCHEREETGRRRADAARHVVAARQHRGGIDRGLAGGAGLVRTGADRV